MTGAYIPPTISLCFTSDFSCSCGRQFLCTPDVQGTPKHVPLPATPNHWEIRICRKAEASHPSVGKSGSLFHVVPQKVPCGTTFHCPQEHFLYLLCLLPCLILPGLSCLLPRFTFQMNSLCLIPGPRFCFWRNLAEDWED